MLNFNRKCVHSQLLCRRTLTVEIFEETKLNLFCTYNIALSKYIIHKKNCTVVKDLMKLSEKQVLYWWWVGEGSHQCIYYYDSDPLLAALYMSSVY